MAHENGDKQRPAKRRHVQGMLDETEPLKFVNNGVCVMLFVKSTTGNEEETSCMISFLS